MTALAALLASVACAATPVHAGPMPKVTTSLSAIPWVHAA
jgi:hypothetical protein